MQNNTKDEISSSNNNELSSQDIEELKKIQSQMYLFLEERFCNNLKTFKKYYPEIAKRFDVYNPVKKFEFFCTQNGIPNLFFTKDNDFFYKTEDPIAYCQEEMDKFLSTAKVQQTKYLQEFDPYGQIHFKYSNQAVAIENSLPRNKDLLIKDVKSFPNCLMIGCGLGYHLARLYEQVEIENLVLVEPDPDLFYASMFAFDWSNLLEYLHESEHQIHFIIGAELDQLFLELESCYTKSGIFLSGSWFTYIHYINDETKKTWDEIKKHYDQIHEAIGFFDDHLFATSQGIELINNKHKFVLKKPLKKEYKDLPVFVIGAGPSLDHDIPFLRKYQDKAIVIACGTAIDSLYHAGIKPDLYVNLERTFNIGDSTLGVIPDKKFLQDIIIVASDTCHRNTLKYFKNSAIFAKNDEPFFPYLTSYYPELENIQEIKLSNPVVGNAGLASAIYFGFENIYLFGIDNGKKIGTSQMHSSFTTLYSNRGVVDNAGSYQIEKVLPGNFGGQCESSFFFAMSGHNIGFLLQMEKLNNDKLICHNCSDGIFMENTIPTHSDELTGEFASKSDIDKHKFSEYLIGEKTAVLHFPEHVFSKLFDSEKFNEICKKSLLMLDNLPDNRSDYVKVMVKLSKYIFELTKYKDTFYYGSVLNGSIQNLFILVSRALYHSSEETKCIDGANRIMNLVRDFLTEAQVLFSYLPDYAMWDHRKYFENGLVGKDTSYGKAPPFPEKFEIIRTEFDDPLKTFVKKYD
ncbi:MAG: 6-hydroxymethylpterin diphosphokinase MptE-like protein [Succinivibrio dextrinosolvens]|nr:6-hydroxymethylpterin diphosphokinase MptE-like protein [Succinivibrio dextrinosolvens]